MVADRPRSAGDSLRLHQPAGHREDARPEVALGRDRLSARRQHGAGGDRGPADVGRQPGSLEEVTRHAEPRHDCADRRHPPGSHLGRAHLPADLRERGRRLHRGDQLQRARAELRAHARHRGQPDATEHHREGIAAAHAAGRHDQPDHLRRRRQPGDLHRQRRELQRERRSGWTRRARRRAGRTRADEADRRRARPAADARTIPK